MWMDSAGVLYSFTATDTLVTNDVIYSRGIGNKRYELTDHLGNVRATVSDVLLDHSGNPDAEVVSYTDYHPYGMAMTGRSSAADGYRYGFNGKENDNEVKGTGNQQDYGARIYDPRPGRWMSTDPLEGKFPFASPYVFALNTPLQAVDPDGRDVLFINGFVTSQKDAGQPSYWRGIGLKRDYTKEYFYPDGSIGPWIGYKKTSFDIDAMDALGDHKPRYFDGSMGGLANQLAGPLLGDNARHISPGNRYNGGRNDGVAKAFEIFEGLEKGGTLKFVMHSEGVVYGHGMAEGILSQVPAWNKLHPDRYIDPTTLIEGMYSYSPFQGSHVAAVPQAGENTYFIGGEDPLDSWIMNLVLGGRVEGVKGSERSPSPTQKHATHTIIDFDPRVELARPQKEK